MDNRVINVDLIDIPKTYRVDFDEISFIFLITNIFRTSHHYVLQLRYNDKFYEITNYDKIKNQSIHLVNGFHIQGVEINNRYFTFQIFRYYTNTDYLDDLN